MTVSIFAINRNITEEGYILNSKKKALEIARLASEKKAFGITILEIKKLSSIADYVVICSADSERQAEAIANHVEEVFRKKKERPLSMEGTDTGQWVLLDFNDVILHVFLGAIRGFYDLDGLWADASKVAFKEAKQSAKG